MRMSGRPLQTWRGDDSLRRRAAARRRKQDTQFQIRIPLLLRVAVREILLLPFACSSFAHLARPLRESLLNRNLFLLCVSAPPRESFFDRTLFLNRRVECGSDSLR
jgi:hypothetical protein